MDAIKLLGMKWKPVEDFSRLTPTVQLTTDKYGVGLKDINRFYREIIAEISQELGVSEEELSKCMNVVNADFMDHVSDFFKYRVYVCDGHEMTQMVSLIKVPTTEYNSEDVAKMFELLSEEEKTKFLKHVTLV